MTADPETTDPEESSSDLVPIGEAALSIAREPSTLRYYEKTGLVVPERSSGGQRRYSTEDLRRLKVVELATTAGLPMPLVRKLLADASTGRRAARSALEQLDRRGSAASQLHAILTSAVARKPFDLAAGPFPYDP